MATGVMSKKRMSLKFVRVGCVNTIRMKTMCTNIFAIRGEMWNNRQEHFIVQNLHLT